MSKVLRIFAYRLCSFSIQKRCGSRIENKSKHIWIFQGKDLLFSLLLECKINIKDFSSFQNEIPEGQRIKVFVTMGSKNYSYDTEDIVTKEVVGRVTKIRGLCLRGDVSNAMDTNQMLEFVEKMQRNEKVEKAVPQLSLEINNTTKPSWLRKFKAFTLTLATSRGTTMHLKV